MEKKRMTLWELWTSKEQEKPKYEYAEDLLFNPLKLHVGDFVIWKGLGEDKTFEVTELVEYSREIVRETFKHTDYLLKEGEETFVLRANGEQLLWLRIYGEYEFDENILNAAKSEVFKIDEEDKDHFEYQKLNAGPNGFLANQRLVSKGSTGSIKREEARYWDFFRETEDGTEFFFVEKNEETGWIMMFQGNQISMEEILVIQK